MSDSEMSDWDVDAYKNDYESEEHWELRRSFMMAHKSNFTESELICLTQVFINYLLMGCKYSPEVMTQVNELAKGKFKTK